MIRGVYTIEQAIFATLPLPSTGQDGKYIHGAIFCFQALHSCITRLLPQQDL